MANLRFPSNAKDPNRSCIVFSTHRATYENNATSLAVTGTGNSVALYMPVGYSVNDILQYDNQATGAVGNLIERYNSNGNNITGTDIAEVGRAVAIDQAANIAGAIALAVGAGAGASAALGGGFTAEAIAGNVVAEKAKSFQETINPRAFILFKAPNIRQFGFNFTLIPSSADEAKAIPDIIKFFRSAAYPVTINGGIQYQFPLAFSVKFVNSKNLIKLPELVCIGTTVTYNPNSMSYFTIDNDNYPVEVSLQLSFQELQPIDWSMVNGGY